MPSTPIAPAAPRVAAVLVAHNGAEWLPRALASLAASRQPHLSVVAVNSGSSDASGAILARELPASSVVTLDRNRGYAAAVAAGLGTQAVRDADLVLLVHDDLVLDPDAVPALVAALAADPGLGAVGPKLRDWGEPGSLQEVGLSVDLLGRVESRLEPGELDQGQHDADREVLFVSSAGMLVRRRLLDELGGLDTRYAAFREDLDLCWRLWLAGHHVAVVPAAVAEHVGAAGRLLRPVGRGRRWEARYFAERHTVATLLKCYGAGRLALVVPLLLVVALGKVLGFLLTRRLGDAVATLRAYAWNAVQLPATFRLRRATQRSRAVADAEVRALLAPGLPRLRAYTGALGAWLAGGGTRALLDEPGTRTAAAERAWRQRPIVLVGAVLLVAYLIGVVGLLGAGQLVGGEVAPWPASAVDFLRAYASPWGAEPLGSTGFASPIQVVLGVVSLLGLGSAWAAQRIVVLGLLPLAWLLALRAGRMVTTRPGPRVAGATLYVLTPVLLGALGEGRLGVLIVAALLPGLVLVAVRCLGAAANGAGAWRAAALLALGLAVAGAAAPSLLPLLGALWAATLVVAVLRWRGGAAALRVLAAGALTGLLLAPWLLELADGGWSRVVAAAPVVDLPLWRAVALAPGVPRSPAGAGAVAATSALVAVGALALGMRLRPVVVSGLLAAWTASSLGAWAAAGWGLGPAWPPALLLPAALARAALAILVVRWLLGLLPAGRPAAVRISAAVLAGTLLVGALGGVLRLAGGPADGLRVDPVLLPAFIGAEPERVGPYRVVLLEEGDGVVRWDVVDAGGPSMLAFGSVPDDGMAALLDAAVGDAVGGGGPAAGAALGRANVRYVVVADGAVSEEVVAAIDRQPALEPLPAGAVRIWQVRSWLPRAAVLPASQAEALLATGNPGDTEEVEEDGLARAAAGRYQGDVPAGSELVVLAEGDGAAWSATADGGRPLARVDAGEVQAFSLEPGDDRVVVEVEGRMGHLLVVAWQALVLLGLASLLLRPPGSRLARAPGAPARPGSQTAGPDLTPTPGSITPPPLVDRPPAADRPDVTGGAR